MPSLLSFVAEVDEDLHGSLSKMATDDDPQTITELITVVDQEKVRNLLHNFVESRSDDVNFCFWWQYMDMVSILLQYTRAHRDGIWDLHLYSFSLMLPYSRCISFQNPSYPNSKEGTLWSKDHHTNLAR